MGPRRSRLAVLAILALLCLVVSACGSSASPATSASAPVQTPDPTERPAPTDEAPESAAPSEAGSDLPTSGRIEVADKGYALTLPDNWFRVDMTDESLQEILGAGVEELPEGFSETMKAQVQQMLQSGVSMLAYRLPDGESELGTNINLIVLPAYGMTLDTLEALNKAQIQQIIGEDGVIETSRVDLAAGEAALLEYSFDSAGANIDQYYLVGDGSQLILTCTIAGAGDVGDECRDIADSVEWLP